ncbi:unnamed protein product [Rangifer tarandus platyrhynchus]|uniref:Uncharacterized protein n=1 Tax=Rangifer tarandus platyrhynchus TaxID=3082113 RepID=A0ABN9A4S3_RANTA|nr:unnamed protein product [Rangifer tarandus platyrhynchus]
MAIGVWQLLLDMGILSSVDQHLYFQDTYVFYQISSDECNYLYWEFEGEEAWQNGVRLLLQLVPLIPSRAGICELSVNIYAGFPDCSGDEASAHNAGDLGLIPGLGRSLGEGSGNPLQYSCLENPMDGGAW